MKARGGGDVSRGRTARARMRTNIEDQASTLERGVDENAARPGRDEDRHTWLSAYAIGLSSAGVPASRVANHLVTDGRAASPTVVTAAIERTRSMLHLDPGTRWKAITALRIVKRQLDAATEGARTR